MIEIWKDVVGYERYFKVSTHARVFSKRTNRFLKMYHSKKGYVTFSSKIGGKQGLSICLRVHRIVAEAFIPNDLAKPEVNHKNGIKHDNFWRNLEWATGKENVHHALLTGLMVPKSGFDIGNSKLSNADISKVLNEYKKFGGTKSLRTLSDEIGIHHTNLSRFVRGVSYKNVSRN